MITFESGKVLDFDIENRPITYWYDGNCTSQITSIAAGFAGSKTVEIKLLRWYDTQNKATLTKATTDMMEWFEELYNKADAVTGHFIRKHDLGIIAATRAWFGMYPLEEKLTIDTKLDMKRSTMPKSQEALGAMLEKFDRKAAYKNLSSKEHMTQTDWFWANNLGEEGVAETERRVVGDVKQHKEMRLALKELNMLNPPKLWRP